MDLTHGMSRRDREDPMQMLPRECGSTVLYVRGLRMRANGGMVVGVRPLLAHNPVPQCGNTAEVADMIAKTLALYSNKVPEAYFAQVMVQTGEAFMELSEWRAATELCFGRCLLSDADAKTVPPPRLASHVRAVVGRAVCAAYTAVERDALVSSPSTLQQLLTALTRLQQGMQLITDRSMDVREALYWVTFNATVRLFSICEALLALGHGAQAVPFLAWAVLCADATPNLCTGRYLPWRLRLFATSAACLEQQGDINSAAKAASEALKRVARLRRELSLNPPVPAPAADLLAASSLQAGVLAFRYEALLNAAAVVQPAAMAKRFATSDQVTWALIAALSVNGKSRRVIDHRPVSQDETAFVTAVLGALLPLATSFNASCLDALKAANAAAAKAAAWSEVTVEEVDAEHEREQLGMSTTQPAIGAGGTGAFAAPNPRDSAVAVMRDFEAQSSGAGSTAPFIPTHLHVSLVRSLFSYEQWEPFQALLGTAEARLTFALDAAGDASAAVPLSVLDEGGAAGSSVPVLSDTNAIDAVSSLRVLSHELLLMRRVYELQYGAVAPLAGLNGDDGDDDGGGGGGFGSSSTTPLLGQAERRPSVRRGGSGRLEGGGSSTKLPGSGATPRTLEGLCTAVSAATKGVLSQFCVTRGDMVFDAIKILWLHASRMTAWLDSRDPGLARTRTSKQAVMSACVMCLEAVHAAAIKASFDDPVVTSTAALRLAGLQRDAGEFSNAVQVLRSALRRLQATRDAAVSQSVFATARPDDQFALSSASVSCFFDLSDATMVSRRPGAGAYGGAGLFGASSQAWVDDQVLSVLHADLLAMLFECELALSAAQSVARREARAGKAAHKAQSSPSKVPAKKGGAGAGAGAGSASKSKAATSPKKHGVRIAEADDEDVKVVKDPNADAAASRPSAACESRLTAECKRNNAWRAILAIKLVKYRKGPKEVRATLEAAEAALLAAEEELASLVALLPTTDGDRVEPSAPAPSRGAVPAASPQLLSRSATVISLRPRSSAAVTAGGGYQVMYGKEFGSGTAVALTSVHLVGLGVKLGTHVDDPYATVPALSTLRPCAGETIVSSSKSQEPIPAAVQVAHVAGLVPNESYGGIL